MSKDLMRELIAEAYEILGLFERCVTSHDEQLRLATEANELLRQILEAASVSLQALYQLIEELSPQLPFGGFSVEQENPVPITVVTTEDNEEEEVSILSLPGVSAENNANEHESTERPQLRLPNPNGEDHKETSADNNIALLAGSDEEPLRGHADEEDVQQPTGHQEKLPPRLLSSGMEQESPGLLNFINEEENIEPTQEEAISKLSLPDGNQEEFLPQLQLEDHGMEQENPPSLNGIKEEENPVEVEVSKLSLSDGQQELPPQLPLGGSGMKQENLAPLNVIQEEEDPEEEELSELSLSDVSVENDAEWPQLNHPGPRHAGENPCSCSVLRRTFSQIVKLGKRSD
ncbi:uncharacterized protein LOC130922583 [Corythoichthys intestinalis]|uniref:uncharacterized protein LOC130922583 n=1 Tax=Corythoichthys intestinalis TaxID=161448 RepID=UPI0025A58EE2|nr:uncharacterized protein LOC130922583 [Corythoichthys intestinalis]